MEAESFFARWSRRNAEAAAEKRASASASAATNRQPVDPVPTPRTPPTLDDVSRLTADSDFTRFVAPGVDETVRRSAMKKLFADPRFNVMDGLDVYIEDYNTFTPIPAAVLAALNHAKELLDPLARLDRTLKAQEDIPAHEASPAARADDDEAASGDMPEEHNGVPAEDQTTDDDPVQGM